MEKAEVFEEGLSFRATIILILTSPSVPPKLFNHLHLWGLTFLNKGQKIKK